MSHWVNDRIADDAIDTVANMSDNDVKKNFEKTLKKLKKLENKKK